MKFSHKVFDLIRQHNERNLATRNSTQILRLLHIFKASMMTKVIFPSLKCYQVFQEFVRVALRRATSIRSNNTNNATSLSFQFYLVAPDQKVSINEHGTCSNVIGVKSI